MGMISTFRFFICEVNRSCRLQSTSAAREGRIIRKMLKRSVIKEQTNFQATTLMKKSNLNSAYANEGSPRITVFNKVYMENITDLFYCGKYSNYINKFGVEITKVQMTKGLNFLNIYYISKKTKVDEEFFNDIMKRAVSELQAKMGELKFFGKVPLVRLINDLRLEHEIKLENIFKSMKLNEGSNSADVNHICTPNFPMNEDYLPEMREDVLGIDVAKIKARISNDIRKFKAININFPQEVKESEIPDKLIKFNKKDFYKFYKRRRIEELKRKKRESQEMYLSETEDDFDDDLTYECDDDSTYDCDKENYSFMEFECLDNFENESDELFNDFREKRTDDSENKVHK